MLVLLLLFLCLALFGWVFFGKGRQKNINIKIRISGLEYETYKENLRNGVKEYGLRRGKVVLLCIHGGNIDTGTEQITRYIAERTNSSVYIRSGRRKNGNTKPRIPSPQFDLQSRPQLKEIIENSELCISIHGHGRNNTDIYVGGLDKKKGKQLGELFKSLLPNYSVVTEQKEIPPNLKGTDPSNIVNCGKNPGIQVELPKSLRQANVVSGWRRHENSKLYSDTVKVGKAIVKFINSLTHIIKE